MKGSAHFNPDPDAEILYTAMKGIGEWGALLCSQPLKAGTRRQLSHLQTGPVCHRGSLPLIFIFISVHLQHIRITFACVRLIYLSIVVSQCPLF